LNKNLKNEVTVDDGKKRTVWRAEAEVRTSAAVMGTLAHLPARDCFVPMSSSITDR